MNVYEELNKLDGFLNLPIGTCRSVIAKCDSTNVAVLNEKLLTYEIVVDADTFIPKEHRIKWKALMQRAGVSKAWWLDGDPNVAELPSTVKKL